MKILIVDDNVDVTSLFSEFLKRKGHSCVVSNSAIGIIPMIKNNSFDLIILDLAMRDYSGSDLLCDLKKEGILKQLRFILCTASSASDYEIEQIMKEYDMEYCLKNQSSLLT